jgi:flagellar motility protein MotE (MotC chaperone)
MIKNIKGYPIETETLSTCCGAGVSHDMCMDCKEHNEGEEVADQDQLFEALKTTRDKKKDLRADIAEAKRNLIELEEELEQVEATESELEQHLIA